MTVNEPVAFVTGIRQFDPVMVDTVLKVGTPLYTHPNEHDLGIAEAIGFDKGYKAATAKTLTDDEITEVFDNTFKVRDFDDAFLKFAKAILRKAEEKC
jgi:hypothetical protein